MSKSKKLKKKLVQIVNGKMHDIKPGLRPRLRPDGLPPGAAGAPQRVIAVGCSMTLHEHELIGAGTLSSVNFPMTGHPVTGIDDEVANLVGYCGDELRLEVHVSASVLADQSMSTFVDVLLFEGASGDTDDLDGEALFDFRIPATPGSNSHEILATVRNTDEDQPDDYGFFILTLTNLPLPTVQPAIQLSGPLVDSSQYKWLVSMGDRLLGVTPDGRVFALLISGNTIGAARLLTGPAVAANPQDKWLVAEGNRLTVITTDGRVFAHIVTSDNVLPATFLPGPLVAANPVDKWVKGFSRMLMVVTSDGRVFTHELETSVLPATRLSGPLVAARPQDKWLVPMNNRLVVVTASGGVFAHPLTLTSVGDAIPLSGQPVAANPQDKWLVAMNNRLLVVTTDGKVFAHDVG
ncbi:MAG: hypothetical protein QM703_11535 [Gemmatales bacterium]